MTAVLSVLPVPPAPQAVSESVSAAQSRKMKMRFLMMCFIGNTVPSSLLPPW